MEMDNISTTFQVFFIRYRQHNLHLKDIHSTNCSGGIQWAWLQFGECLLRPSHILGYWMALIASPLWILGLLWCYHSMARHSGQRLLGYLTLTFIMDIFSLAGSVLSMQVLLLIVFGVVTLAIDCLAIVIIVVARKSLTTPRYEEVHNKLLDLDSPPRPDPGPGVPYTKRCCQLGCLFLASGVLLLVLLLTVTKQSGTVSSPVQHALGSSGSFQTVPSAAASGLYIVQGLIVVGYVLGCVTCACNVGLNVLGVRFSTRNLDLVDGASSNQRPVCKEALLLTFDLLFVVSVLLQCGGLHLALSALPWIVQRLIHGSFQILLIDHKRCPQSAEKFDEDEKDGGGDDGDDDDDDDIIFDKEDRHLLKSSESGESRTGVECPVTDDQTSSRALTNSTAQVSFDDKTQCATASPFWPASVMRGRPRNFSFETISSTESEVSSMSQIREIELYRDRKCSIPRIVVQPCDSNFPTSRPGRLSLRMPSLSDASMESHDQRVRSWVSQHTPEEELVLPPSLALTLNLDSTTSLSSPTSPCGDLDPECSHLLFQGELFPSCRENAGTRSMSGFTSFPSSRLIHTLGVLSMTPRKNSL